MCDIQIYVRLVYRRDILNVTDILLYTCDCRYKKGQRNTGNGYDGKMCDCNKAAGKGTQRC